MNLNKNYSLTPIKIRLFFYNEFLSFKVVRIQVFILTIKPTFLVIYLNLLGKLTLICKFFV